MNRLKILKFIVFLMTFCIVLLLCIAMMKMTSPSSVNNFALNLDQQISSKITSAYATGERLFVTVDDQKIFIVDLNKMSLAGKVNLNREDEDGQEE